MKELPLVPFLCLCLTEPGKRVNFNANAKTGLCPCGLEVFDTRNESTILRREIIHFDAPSIFAGRGVGFAACDPAIKTPGPADVMFSGDVGGVTCPGCMETEAFQRVNSLNGNPNVPTAADHEWKPPVRAGRNS